LHFLSPVLLDYVINGNVQKRIGNADPEIAPHGVFPCRDKDTWCAIAVEDEVQWHNFCNALGKQEWLVDERFMNNSVRKLNEAVLNDLISKATVAFNAQELMHLLQENKVSAGVVQTTRDAISDPQLNERNAFWMMEHPEIGQFRHMGSSLSLSDTPPSAERPAPCIGEHTLYVLQDVLNLSEEEISQLLVNGVCMIT